MVLQTDAVQACVSVLQAHSSRWEVMCVATDFLTSIADTGSDGKMQTLQYGGSKMLCVYLGANAAFATSSLTIHEDIVHKIVDFMLLLALDQQCSKAMRQEGCAQASSILFCPIEIVDGFGGR